MDWDAVGFVKGSTVRERILRSLSSRPSTPKEVTKALGISFSQVSGGLHQLMDRELVVCLTPRQRKGKIYSATARGREVLARV